MTRPRTTRPRTTRSRSTGSRRVLVIIGSESDLQKVEPVIVTLSNLGLEYELRVASAHRTPDRVVELVTTARERGFGVIVAAAGLSAALPGVAAAHTTLPVVAMPVAAGTLGGLDALLSCTQMPPGVPVASVGIDSGRNAALLAAEILAVSDPLLAERLEAQRREQARSVVEADARVGRARR